MKLTLLILFNLVTAVGGHFVNRRWDKAFLLFVVMILIFSLPWFYLQAASFGFNYSVPFEYYPHIQLGFIFCFSLLSTSLFVIDFRKPRETFQPTWTGTMTVAAGVFCMVSTLYIGWFVFIYLDSAKRLGSIRVPVMQEREGVEPRKTFFRDDFFSDSIYFSFDGLDVLGPMPVPPPGDAILYGTFVHNGTPVEGIKLDVVLGDQFKVESLVTDAAGRFSFSVKPGIWKINAILVSGWSGKPEGEFVIVTGREGRAGEDQYHKNRYPSGDLAIEAISGKSTAIITMEINSAIKITTPVQGSVKSIDDTQGLKIQWEQSDRAAFYLVSLSKVTEEGAVTSFHPIAQARTEGFSMGLSRFTLFEDPGATNTYSAKVFAFDDEGNFVSESKHLGRHMFAITGFKIAADEVVSELGEDVSPEKYEEFYQNNRIIAAAETLLENRLVDEAEKVVALITENSRAGKIDALKGYILAVQGDCENANVHFNKAVKIGGLACLPQKYRHNCP